MLSSLSTAVSGMQAYQTSLDVIANNISNSNTTGYKASRTDFADALSQTDQSSTPATSTTSGVASVQVGTGVTTVSVQSDFSQGTINSTGVASDMAISGEGYFIVKDATSGQTYVTRAGDFTVDTNGYLVTTGGLRVQGYTDTGLTTIGDIKIDAEGKPDTSTGSYSSYSVDTTGTITVRLSDGSSFTRGQVLLQSFTNPGALSKEGDNLYSYLSDAGPSTTDGTAPGTGGLGTIKSQSLEASNVDLTEEMANMIVAQRAFQANSRVITTSDEILQEIVGLKR